MSIESYITPIIKGVRHDPLARLIRTGLVPAHWVYGAAVSVRNSAFDHGWIKEVQVHARVISVGNIVVGGTGKTPVTLAIAEQLAKNQRVAILCRGYRSDAENSKAPQRVDPSKKDAWRRYGDEPTLMAARLKGVPVYAGANRVDSAKQAIADGAEMLILDDGMQHRYLARDEEIVVVDARDPLGTGYLLPRGFLREPPSSLARADKVILVNADEQDVKNRALNILQCYTKAAIVSATLEVSGIYDLQEQVVGSVSGKKVGLITSIARPYRFKKTVEKLGAEVVDHLELPDHQPIPDDVVDHFTEKCLDRGASLILCTEKDKVKLKQQPQIAYIKVDMAGLDGLFNSPSP